jgi:hypothetical protein
MKERVSSICAQLKLLFSQRLSQRFHPALSAPAFLSQRFHSWKPGNDAMRADVQPAQASSFFFCETIALHGNIWYHNVK